MKCFVLLLFPLLVAADNPPVYNKIAEWGTGNYVAVSVVGDFAYCAANPYGIDIIDISQPGTPLKVGGLYEYEPEGRRLVTNERWLITKSYNREELQIYDLTDPGAPLFTGTFPFPDRNDNPAFTIQNNLLLTTNWEGMKIYDITDPKNPILQSTTPLSEARQLKAHGNLVAVNVTPWRVVLFDISDPSAPIELAVIEPEEFNVRIYGIVFYEHYLVLGERYVVGVYDISDPTNPQTMGKSESLRDVVRQFFIHDNIVYVVHAERLRRVDITDPVQLELLEDYIPTNNRIFGISAIYNGNVALANEHTGFALLNVQDPENPAILGQFNQAGQIKDLVHSGNFLYGVYFGGMFRVWDVSDPSQPTVTFYRPPGDNISAIAVHNEVLYLAVENRLEAHDLTENPGIPKLIDSINIIGPVYDFHFYGDRMLFTDAYGMNVVDISQPKQLFMLSQVSITGQAGRFTMQHHHVFLPSNESLMILRLEPDGNLIQIWETPQYEHISETIVLGTTLHLFQRGTTRSFDVSNPLAPVEIDPLPLPDFFQPIELFLVGDRLFAHDNYSAVMSYDVSDPDNPVLEETSYDFGGGNSVFPTESHVYAAEPFTGKLGIYEAVRCREQFEAALVQWSHGGNILGLVNLVGTSCPDGFYFADAQ